MSVAIALLRAVNVGGRGAVPMIELRAAFEALGCAGARTLLTTGNVVFRAPRGSADALERRIAAAVEERFGLRTDVFVRTAAEWDDALAANPFPHAATKDPAHLVVVTLADAPAATAVDALAARIVGRETVGAVGRTLYAVYPERIGNSKLTMPLIEKVLLTRGTGRNWNTAVKLQALTRDA